MPLRTAADIGLAQLDHALEEGLAGLVLEGRGRNVAELAIQRAELSDIVGGDLDAGRLPDRQVADVARQDLDLRDQVLLDRHDLQEHLARRHHAADGSGAEAVDDAGDRGLDLETRHAVF